jgi:hypothetical protein
MKIVKFFFALLLILGLGLVSCESLEVENLNAPDRERALADPGDLLGIMRGGAMDMMWGLTDLHGIYFQCQADLNTSTNRYLDFWGFADEPRVQFQNSVTYDGYRWNWYPWSNFNSAVTAANTVLQAIEDGLVLEENDVDRTADAEAAAYFVKGMSQGFLGVMFDKAYIVDLDSDLSALEFSDYKALIAAGLANLQTAIDKANAAPADFKYDFFPNTDLDKATFIQMCNSFRAKIAISEARTKDETIQTAYSTIKGWVDAGFTDDYYIESSPGEWWNNMIDWLAYRLNFLDESGYIPSDQKIFHLVNPDQYQEYYHQDTGFYSPVVTDDQRIYNAPVQSGDNGYYYYVQGFGYLNPDRNRYIFTVHTTNRWYVDNDFTQVGVMNPTFLFIEGQLIKAECDLKEGIVATTQTVMNDPNLPRKAVGQMPDVTIANEADALWYLHYEYSVEMDMAGLVTGTWAFMRRWDLLQAGTMTMLPIPARELEATGLDIYTFGGALNAGQEGSAAGPGWRTVENGQ